MRARSDPRSGAEDAEPRGFPRKLTLTHLWVLAAVALPMLAALRDTLATIDLAFGVRAGTVMVETGGVLRTDVFSFTAAGAPWLNQQWGGQVLLALIHRATGWVGLALIQAVLFSAAFLFVFLACRAAGARTKHAAWLTLAAFPVALAGRGLRAQLIGMLLFAITTWLVMDRSRHPRRLWAIPVLVAIWANVHGSFVLVPLLLALVWFDDRRRRVPAADRTLAVAGLSVAAVTLNPFGLRVWSYAVGISTNPLITRQIEEWQPPSPRDAPGLLFFLSILALVAFLARRGTKAPWPTLLSMGAFVGIGLLAVRGIFWWAIVGPALVATLLEYGSPPPSPERGSILNTGIAAVIVALIAASLPFWRPPGALDAPRGLLEQAPPGITAALDRTMAPGDRMFNPQAWGSWLIFALPDHRVFVDSRIEVFPEAVWDDYFTVSGARDGWQEVLDRWNIDVVVAHREQQEELIPRIRADTGWRQVYADRDGLLFVRA